MVAGSSIDAAVLWMVRGSGRSCFLCCPTDASPPADAPFGVVDLSGGQRGGEVTGGCVNE